MTMVCDDCGKAGIRWMGQLANLTHTECPHCGGKNCQRAEIYEDEDTGETVEAATPEHLRPIPEETVRAIVKRVNELVDCLDRSVPNSWQMQLDIDQEVRAFAITRAPMFGRQLAEYLEDAAKELCRKSEPGASGSALQIAKEIEAAIEKAKP